MITKKNLKKTMLQMRDKLSPEEVSSLSLKIFENVFSLDCYKKARSVFIYYSFKNEVSTLSAIKEMLKTKTVYIPKINGGNVMTAVKINENTSYSPNRLGICEPLNGEAGNYWDIDLCITPGVAFDKYGARAGYGKAYYDIFLRGTNIYKLAVCYDFQIVDCIPVDLLDVCMDCIVTDKRILMFNGCRY
jgi:5-formyltetrahydrofolate cyclo-ligase